MSALTIWPGFVAQSRVRIIRKTLLGAATRPVTGFGWANADYAFEKIDWPIKEAIVSEKDQGHPLLKDFKSPFII